MKIINYHLLLIQILNGHLSAVVQCVKDVFRIFFRRFNKVFFYIYVQGTILGHSNYVFDYCAYRVFNESFHVSYINYIKNNYYLNTNCVINVRDVKTLIKVSVGTKI